MPSTQKKRREPSENIINSGKQFSYLQFAIVNWVHVGNKTKSNNIRSVFAYVYVCVYDEEEMSKMKPHCCAV